MTTTGYADRTALLPVSTKDNPDGRPGTKLTGFWEFTIHETGNEVAGASAEFHRRYWMPGGDGALISSIHFVVDALESVQLIPTDELAWHIGDGADQPLTDASYHAVGVEICVNSRAGFPAACRKAAKIVAKVLKDKGAQPLDGTVIRKHGSHPETTHKQCPAHLNAGDWGVTWLDFVAMVKAEFTLLYVVDYRTLWGDSADYDRVKDFGIVVEWRRAAMVLGAPTSDEHADRSGCITRHFVGGYVRYDPKTQKCISYFARAST